MRGYRSVIEGHQKEAWTCEYRIVRPDGSIRWIYDRGYPILDLNGDLSLRAGVSTDITDRKKSEGISSGRLIAFALLLT